MYNFDISAISDLCNSFRPHNPQLIREIPIKYATRLQVIYQPF